jgi:hypothetical protein
VSHFLLKFLFLFATTRTCQHKSGSQQVAIGITPPTRVHSLVTFKVAIVAKWIGPFLKVDDFFAQIWTTKSRSVEMFFPANGTHVVSDEAHDW